MVEKEIQKCTEEYVRLVLVQINPDLERTEREETGGQREREKRQRGGETESEKRQREKRQGGGRQREKRQMGGGRHRERDKRQRDKRQPRFICFCISDSKQ